MKNSYAVLSLGLSSLILFGGCANSLNEKRRDEMSSSPPKYEAPYDQIPQAQPEDYNFDYKFGTLSDTKNEAPKPIQVYPENYATVGNGMNTEANKTYEAIPAPGKPGFVISPYAPKAGLVDIKGFPPGSEVKDPYTGKVMTVPLETKYTAPPQKEAGKTTDNQKSTGSPILAPIPVQTGPAVNQGPALIPK